MAQQGSQCLHLRGDAVQIGDELLHHRHDGGVDGGAQFEGQRGKAVLERAEHAGEGLGLPLGHVLQQPARAGQFCQHGVQIAEVELALRDALKDLLEADAFHFRQQAADGHALHFQRFGNFVAQSGVLHFGVQEGQFPQRFARYGGDVAEFADDVDAFPGGGSHGEQGLGRVRDVPELKGGLDGVFLELGDVGGGLGGVAHHDVEGQPGLLHGGGGAADARQAAQGSFYGADACLYARKGQGKAAREAAYGLSGFADFLFDVGECGVEFGGVAAEGDGDVSHGASGV